jgi:hypothetical protein
MSIFDPSPLYHNGGPLHPAVERALFKRERELENRIAELEAKLRRMQNVLEDERRTSEYWRQVAMEPARLSSGPVILCAPEHPMERYHE